VCHSSITDDFSYRTMSHVAQAQLDAIKATKTRFQEESLVGRRYGQLGPVGGFIMHVGAH
jgi:hypothetical protein